MPKGDPVNATNTCRQCGKDLGPYRYLSPWPDLCGPMCIHESMEPYRVAHEARKADREVMAHVEDSQAPRARPLVEPVDVAEDDTEYPTVRTRPYREETEEDTIMGTEGRYRLCRDCGRVIQPTGKRGRPAVRCAECKGKA